MKDCKMCTDNGYKLNLDGYVLCKKHYKEVENLREQLKPEEE